MMTGNEVNGTGCLSSRLDCAEEQPGKYSDQSMKVQDSESSLHKCGFDHEIVRGGKRDDTRG